MSDAQLYLFAILIFFPAIFTRERSNDWNTIIAHFLARVLNALIVSYCAIRFLEVMP